MSISLSENSIVTALEKSEFTFYLTGSRFFGNYHQDSDYDFFTEDVGVFLRNFLYESGFRVLSKATAYKDWNAKEVWEYQNVHVQVVNNLSLKRKAQVLLNTVPFKLAYLAADKRHRHYFWENAYRAIRAMNGL